MGKKPLLSHLPHFPQDLRKETGFLYAETKVIGLSCVSPVLLN
jgi:hypothetical protein